MFLKIITSCFVAISSLQVFPQGKISRPNRNSSIVRTTSKSDSRLFTDLSKVQIGDWMMSDGRFSHEKISGIDYAGVVYSLSPSKADAQRGWIHGYIVALKDAKRGRCPWGPESDVGDIPNRDYPEMQELINDRNGFLYSKCATIKSSTKNAFYYARNYPKHLPTSFSGWFLPSVGQWVEIIKNLGKVPVKVVVKNQSTGYKEAQFDVASALSNLKRYGFKEDDYSCYWTANEKNKLEGFKQECWVIWLTSTYNYSYSHLYTLVKETTRMGVRAVAAF